MHEPEIYKNCAMGLSVQFVSMYKRVLVRIYAIDPHDI
jgi:hypothetical protein